MNAKRITLSLVVSALFAGMGVAPAVAQNTPAIDRAQIEISARIQQGVATGHITPPEAQRLMQRERELARMEVRFRADGRVTPQERQRLRQDLAELRAEVERIIASRVVARPVPPPASDGLWAQIEARIQQGIQSGHLTQREVNILQQQQRQISRMERRFNRDGRIDRGERRELQREMISLRNHVEVLMNNDERERRRGRGPDRRG